MNNTNWLAIIFDFIGDTFEKFNPAAFRFLSSTLPYASPLPVAWLTMKSAAEFLEFTPQIAFVFVYTLEGMGLWFTSLLVDSVVDWIKSKNVKTSGLVILFGFVVTVYVYILVNLNVTLKASTGTVDENLSMVITFLCFLPLLTGIGNGYYKIKQDGLHRVNEEKTYKRKQEEQIRQEKREDRNLRYAMRHGFNPYAQDVQVGQLVGQNPSVQGMESVKLGFSGNWKVDKKSMTVDDFRWIASATVQELQQKFPITRSTAYNWMDYATKELERIE